METVRPKSSINERSKKFAKTFQKVIGLRTATKIAANNGICLLATQARFKEDDFTCQNQKKNEDNNRARNRAVMEALIARLFAGVTAIKAAYAELQMAQDPYNNDAIQAADQAIVDELRAISELKRAFLKKELDLSPQVTLMLAEIQEQQSIMKTYEITIKKLEAEADHKELDIASLKNQLQERLAFNKSLEKKLNSSGALSMFENLRFSALNPTHFIQFLHHTIRSVRSFAKLMIKEMESAHWDLEAAIKFIHPDAVFAKPSHKSFAFESFVCITMFEGFNYPNFIVPSEPFVNNQPHRHSPKLYFEKFRKLKSLNPKQCITQNPSSSFAKFLKFKYLQLVHAKMECSLFRNLNQRKLVNSGGFPDSAFFVAFAEMAKRVWELHSLAYSFDEEVTVFQVKRNTRFSEVYMACVAEDSVFPSAEASTADEVDLRVGFTVVPGFKIGKTVIQSRVYLSPVVSAASS
ncbi:protein GRAVITROPIC IN THE LIGHT 1 [Neltuma alba]|uniref:protein GRAVITROPIC IN THE LIGHT 1 n=1 Tax=Neltuma alba TaxID=207710 RepID=UPI0010A32715|nr:protein GRAVITROPIC IN THE LIGHT 1 [Prosopis alba]